MGRKTKLILRINFKRFVNLQVVLTIFVVYIFASNFYKFYGMEKWKYKFIVTHPFASYDDKMRRTVGSVFYNFTQFINVYTPNNSFILMPPQAFPWPQSGNGAFLRYFIYPRSVGNGQESVAPSKSNLSDIDYILLDWGEDSVIEGTYTHGWPKFDVPAEKIILMNEDGSFGGEIKGDFHYKDYAGKEVWGLIKVKH